MARPSVYYYDFLLFFFRFLPLPFFFFLSLYTVFLCTKFGRRALRDRCCV